MPTSTHPQLSRPRIRLLIITTILFPFLASIPACGSGTIGSRPDREHSDMHPTSETRLQPRWRD